jgi:hypothetical protein
MLRFRVSVALVGGLLLGGCRAPTPPDATVSGPPVGPAQTVQRLTRHLEHNQLAAFAREAVPPALHARLEDAWRAGRTRWPLDELPFGARLPGMLQTLAAPGAETRLLGVFDRQFAGADRQLHGAAASLGVFGVEYVRHRPGFGDDQRVHYAQLVEAAARWGTHAALGDRRRARNGLAILVPAARRTGLTADGAFRTAGMDESLRRLGPFVVAFKQALRAYGLELDRDLASLRASLQQQTGDSARVRMQYRFAGSDIDTVVSMQRIDGRWYVVDFLRHAQAAAAPPAPASRVADNRAAAAPAAH